MKYPKLIISLLLLGLSSFAFAGAGHDHSSHGHATHAKQAGPNGGRIIHELDPHIEFFVREDRKVQLTAFDHDGEVVSPEKLTAMLVGGSRGAPVHMKFAQEGDVLVSNVALPEMAITPVVLTLKLEGGKAVRVKFNVNLSDCGSCDYKEYACICGH